MSKEPVKHDEHMPPEQRADIENADTEQERMRREDPLFIEKTRPEDPSGRPGQLTRDNVTPKIPSGKRGDPPNSGGIVDPNSLGMEQGGVAPKAAPEATPDQVSGSINEPQTPSFHSAEDVPVPSVTSIDPASCAIGDDDFTLDVTGENFMPGSVIVFAGHNEPTTLNEDGTLSTGVKPSLWSEAVVVKCSVRNGPVMSNEVDFTFSAPAGRKAKSDDDDDDLEDEIDEAIEDGDAKRIPKKKKR